MQFHRIIGWTNDDNTVNITVAMQFYSIVDGQMISEANRSYTKTRKQLTAAPATFPCDILPTDEHY